VIVMMTMMMMMMMMMMMASMMRDHLDHDDKEKQTSKILHGTAAAARIRFSRKRRN